MKYRHKKSGEILEFVKSYGDVWLMKGKVHTILPGGKKLDSVLSHKNNLIKIDLPQQGTLF